MNLIWHITRKDLRRFWIPLALIGAVTLLRLGVGRALLRADAPDPEWFVRMGMYANVLRGLGLAVVYLLVAAVVQADSLAGPAFWQTRPIPRSRLLLAKVFTLCLMFGLLPLLVALPWWLGCGFGFREVLQAGAGVMGIQAGVVLLALPFSVVTDGFGRFLLYSLIAAVAGFTAFVDLAAHVPGLQPSSEGAGATRIVLLVGIAAAASIAVTIHQYATRRTARSLVLIGAGSLALLATASWCTWDASPLWAPRPLAPSGLTREVKVSLAEAALYRTGSEEKLAYGTVVLALDGVPAHYGVTGLYSDQALRWPDGKATRQSRADPWGSWFPVGDAERNLLLGIKPLPEVEDADFVRTRARRLLRREAPGPQSPEKPQTTSFFLGLDGELGERVTTQPSTLEGSYRFGLVQPMVVGERPLAVGSEFQRGSQHTRVAGLTRDPGEAAIKLALVERAPSAPLVKFDPIYVFVNAARTEGRDGLNEVRFRAVVEGVEIVLRRDVLRAPGRWDARLHRFQPVAGAFEQGSLAEIQNHLVQRFNRDLVVPRFLMKAPPAAPVLPEALGAVTVSGAVNRPLSFEARRGETVLEALRDAGGFTDTADLGAVTLTRIGDDGQPVKLVLDVGPYLDGRSPSESFPALRAGDLIQVPERKQP